MSTLTVAEVCDQLRVDEHTVLAWIRSGELPASNVGVRPGLKKPRWRITPAALEQFLESRRPQPSAPKTRKRKRNDDEFSFY
jgi:excisionase family DNA binding protein